MKIAYGDCFSGVSGNMFLGALLDVGLPKDHLLAELSKLDIQGYDIQITQKQEGALQGIHVTVATKDDHPHRPYKKIKELIQASTLSERIKGRALAVFKVLAEAEAKVHDCEVEAVHFHEVGGVDSLVDIVGCAVGIDYLGIEDLVMSPLPMPRGWVKCAHGLLPVPAPAVCEILQGVPVYGVDFDLEMVTPTGASLAKAWCSGFGSMPPMTINATGYGSGSRKLATGQPNLFRLIIGESERLAETQTVEVIETNLDDWSPETFPFLSDRLFDQGALDVSLVPIQMKKGRPGFLIRVIGSKAAAYELKKTLLSETSAIGLRFRDEQRWTLPRQKGNVETQWGKVQVKKIKSPQGDVLTPEYEDCCRIAKEHNVLLKDVYAAVNRSALESFKEEK